MSKQKTAVVTGGANGIGKCIGDQYVCIVMNSSYYGRYTDTRKLYERCLAKTSLMPDRAA